MKKNLIRITRHPSVSCYVEEGTRSGNLRAKFVSELLAGGYSARTLDGVGSSEFYLNFRYKTQVEKELWVGRLRALRAFASSNMS